MAGILKRTIFVHQDKDKVVFHDWARVITSQGTCVEPRCLMAMRPVNGVAATASLLDLEDDISRIDTLEHIDIGKEKSCLSDEKGSTALHGGMLWPRVGY